MMSKAERVLVVMYFIVLAGCARDRPLTGVRTLVSSMPVTASQVTTDVTIKCGVPLDGDGIPIRSSGVTIQMLDAAGATVGQPMDVALNVNDPWAPFTATIRATDADVYAFRSLRFTFHPSERVYAPPWQHLLVQVGAKQ